jgi:transposase
MSFYLVAGQGPRPAPVAHHLPTRRARRYPSDSSDLEWQVMAPHIPIGGPCARVGGRPVSYSRRDIVDAIRYLDHNGCVWRALPADFPPWRTVYHYFRAWCRDGTWERVHDALRAQVRTQAGHDPSPSAAIIDSQSVKTTEKGGSAATTPANA